MMTSFFQDFHQKKLGTLRKSYISGLSWLARIPVRTRFPRPPPPWPEVNKVKVPPISGGDLGSQWMDGWHLQVGHQWYMIDGENPPRAPKTKMTSWNIHQKNEDDVYFRTLDNGRDFEKCLSCFFYWVYFLGRSFVWSHQSIKDSSSIWVEGSKQKQLLYTVLTTFP